jgi:3-hydroxyisobutyrate dehydrogenase-like beta-hydroxyacid dehydrogenase
MKVGFIGLGAMGQPMALNLVRAGHELTVYNRTPGRTAELERAGARVAQSVADAAISVEMLITMLADDRALEETVIGSQTPARSQPARGALAALSPGAVHVAMSTTSPALSRRLTQAHQAAGQAFIAAPVFGRPNAAADRKLLIVAAGPPKEIERCRPVLDALGQAVFVVSDQAWVANVVKLAGNFMIFSAIETLAEAFVLVRKAGVEAERFLEIINGGLFKSPIYQNYGTIIAEERYEPAGFKLRLGLKDVSLVLEAAGEVGVTVPIADLVRNQFIAAIERGLGEIDWAGLGRLNAENAGLGARAKPAP